MHANRKHSVSQSAWYRLKIDKYRFMVLKMYLMSLDIRSPAAALSEESEDALEACLSDSGFDRSSRIGIVLQAGPNRQMNISTTYFVATRIQNILDLRNPPSVIARVDDEEVHPQDIASLRRMRMRDRIERARGVTKSYVLRAIPSLLEMQEVLPADVPLHVTVQPQCTSYMEQKWALCPPDAAMAMPDDTEDLLWIVGSQSLRRRMLMAACDAEGESNLDSRARVNTIVHRGRFNEERERKALIVARMLRSVLGASQYEKLCLGEGMIGRAYKLVQDLKVRATARDRF